MSVSGNDRAMQEERPDQPVGAAPGSSSSPNAVVASRRPHRKSRRGCSQCKLRRIKCDESKPSCAKCIHYSTPCSFLQLQPVPGPTGGPEASTSAEQQSHTSTPTSRPSRGSQKPPPHGQIPTSLTSLSFQGLSGAFSISDLELFLFFSTHTYLTIPPAELWPAAVSALAFNHPFIAHEIIALSALHKAYLEPARKEEMYRDAHRHHEIALTGFQSCLLDINETTYHPLTMAACLITVYAFASRTGNLFLHDPIDPHDPGRVELVQLLRGQKAIVSSGRTWLRSGPMWRSAEPWFSRSLTEQPSASDAAHLQAVSSLFHPSSNSPYLPHPASAPLTPDEATALSTTFTLLGTMFSVTNPSNSNRISDAEGALGLLSHIPTLFHGLVEKHEPRALVLLAHYCILLKRADQYWWLEGSAERLMGAVRRALGDGGRSERWEGWIEWPIREVSTIGGERRDMKSET